MKYKKKDVKCLKVGKYVTFGGVTYMTGVVLKRGTSGFDKAFALEIGMTEAETDASAPLKVCLEGCPSCGLEEPEKADLEVSEPEDEEVEEVKPRRAPRKRSSVKKAADKES